MVQNRERSTTGLSAVTLYNLYAEHMMRNAGLDELKARIEIRGRNIKILRYVDNTTITAESKEELKNILMRVTEERERASFRRNIF